MTRRSKTGDGRRKTRRRESVTPKRRPLKIARRRNACTRGAAAKIAQLTRELNEALQQQAATAEVLHIISASPGDLQLVFDTLLTHARRLCDAGFGNIYRWDGEALHLVATHNTPPTFAEFRGRMPFRPSTTSLIGRMVKTKTVMHVPDARDNRDYTDRTDLSLVAAIELGGVRTYLAVPMLKDSELIGAFTVYRQEVRPFTEKEIALITSFANQAVIAIENTRLMSELRQMVQQQSTAADVLNVISHSTFDLQTVLDTLVESAVRLCDADLAAMHRQEAPNHRVIATYGGPSTHKELASGVPFEPGRGSVIARAVLERKPVHVVDVLADPEYALQSEQSKIGYRTVLGVPLLREGIPIGIIVLMRFTVRPFSEPQIALVQNFAAHAVVAIENTRLLHELRQRTDELARSVGELQGLGEVSQAVNSTLDLATVLSTIVAKAVQLSGTEAGAIYVLDDLKREFHLGAAYGTDQEFIDAFAQLRLSLDNRKVALTFAQGEPVQVADVKEEAPSRINEITLRAGYRARLVAPLMRAGQPVGLLVVRRRTPGPFAPNSIELMKTFAAQSVLAIQNARLFERVEARTRELAKSLEALQRERNNKLMDLEAMAASIGHEVRQPLGAIASNGSAARRFLGQTPPNLEETRLALDRIIRDTHRASQVFDSIRALFGKGEREQERIDVNELTLGVLQALREELKDHNVAIRTELPPELPPIMGHKGQLQEVLINLVRNAIEAMDTLEDEHRILQVSAHLDGGNAIVMAVEDSGPGIAPQHLDSIFEAFITTKPHGMGLGLALCRMIIERHDGELSAAPANPRGAVFRIVLPAAQAAAETPVFPES